MTTSSPEPVGRERPPFDVAPADRSGAAWSGAAASGLAALRARPVLTALAAAVAAFLVQVLAFRNSNLLIPGAVAVLAWLVLRAAADAPRRRAEGRLADLGFRRLDVAADPAAPDLGASLVRELATPELLGGIEAIYREAARDSRRYLLSVALPQELARTASGAGSVGEQVADGLVARAVERLRQATGGAEQEIRSDLALALSVEVWPLRGAPATAVWYRFKRQLTVKDRATHFLGSERRNLRQGEEVAARSWRVREVDRLAAVPDAALVIGPEHLETAVVDVVDPEVVGEYRVAELARDPELRRRLGLRVTEYAGGWALERGTTTHQKGWLRLEGAFRSGAFQGLEELKAAEHKTPLDRTIPNVLRRVGGADRSERINPLLGELMSSGPLYVEETVRSNGNFAIDYGAVREGSDQERYWIEPAPGPGVETRYWTATLGGAGLHRNPDNYRPLPPGERSLIPFSSGYLMTGIPEEDRWLCLELNVGSPGIGTPEGGTTRIETADLRAILRRFAGREGIEELEWVEGSHGVIAHGRSPEGGRVWLTLCEPRHVARHQLKETVSDLLAGGALPRSLVRLEFLDRHGRPVELREGLMTVVAPELPMVEARLLARRWGSAGGSAGESAGAGAAAPIGGPIEAAIEPGERLDLCRRLAAFARRVLATGSVCVDFTLDQTAVWGDRVFVCDYTAYVPLAHHRRESTKKPEYRAPEEISPAFGDLAPEPFTVFTLGLLFFQVLTAEPGASGLPFPAAFRERDREPPERVDPAAYREALRAELRAAPPLGHLALAALVAGMLAWEPRSRPSLDEVEAELEVRAGGEPPVRHGARPEPSSEGEAEPKP